MSDLGPIALLGVGTMGEPMGRNLLKAGATLRVCNRTAERCAALVAAGASPWNNPRDAARDAHVVLVCVTDGPDVEDVLFGPEGAVHGLSAGALVIDTSTIAPAIARRCAARLAARRIGFVDAPVSGGPEGAARATLAIMVGASAEDFRRARPVLECLGTTVTHVGPVGSGQVAKAVNQVVLAGTYQAVAEGLVLAARLGVDPQRVVDAIQGGAARSWVLEKRSGNMLADQYPLGFKISLHRKDLSIALEAARAVGVALPVTALVASAEDGLIGRGHGDDDVSALARTVRANAGIPPGPLLPQQPSARGH